MLLIRLLIYASVIVVSSVRFIPFNLNLNSRPYTLEAFNFNRSNPRLKVNFLQTH